MIFICDALLTFLSQVQALKVLVNVSSNPDMIDDIVQAQVRIQERKSTSLSDHVI